jgi:GTP-binding protein Era
MNAPVAHRAGFAALIGRPNVGKSTLMNALLNRKLSIVSPKPQTTRHRILGILNRPDYQLVLVDTPGIHAGQKRMLNKYMNRSAQASLGDADLVVFVVEALRWSEEDEQVLERIRQSGRPALALVNKVDRVHPKERLLPFLQELGARHAFVDVVPLSAHRAADVARLPGLLAGHLPESPPLFPPEQYTDRGENFRMAEAIREKLTLRLKEELPYGLTVEIERTGMEEGRYVVHAIIWVEREGQKAIVIGEGGERLREIGRAARLELNELCGRRVHLELWVKVKDNWADSAKALRQFGYDNS